MSTATDMLAAYRAAELAVLKGESYRIGDLMLTRSNLSEIVTARKEWERRVSDEQRAAATPAQQSTGPLSVWGAKFGEPRGYYQDRDW